MCRYHKFNDADNVIPKYLHRDGECYPECDDGGDAETIPEYEDEVTGKCELCHPTCKTCNGRTENNCLTCYNLYWLTNEHSCSNICGLSYVNISGNILELS